MIRVSTISAAEDEASSDLKEHLNILRFLQVLHQQTSQLKPTDRHVMVSWFQPPHSSSVMAGMLFHPPQNNIQNLFQNKLDSLIMIWSVIANFCPGTYIKKAYYHSAALNRICDVYSSKQKPLVQLNPVRLQLS